MNVYCLLTFNRLWCQFNSEQLLKDFMELKLTSAELDVFFFLTARGRLTAETRQIPFISSQLA